MSARRTMALVAVTAVAAVTLTGCIPSRIGRVGVGVDTAGNPVGYLKVCPDEQMDTAYLFAEPTKETSKAVATWESRPAATGSSSWSFADPRGVWTRRSGTPALRPRQVYSLSASGHEWGTTEDVLFTPEDLAAMKPGQVRVYVYDKRLDEEFKGSAAQQSRHDSEISMQVISQQEFERQSCDV